MNLHDILKRIQSGDLDIDAAADLLREYSFVDMEAALTDFGRAARCGLPEAVLAESKSVEQVIQIVDEHLRREMPVLVTRLKEDQMAALAENFPELCLNRMARTARWGSIGTRCDEVEIAICCAGSSDLSVAEEARETATFLGRKIELVCDVGVAGIHRLFHHLKRIRRARVVIAIAGMEGTLPGVIAGLVAQPVIAVPTSVGYGRSRDGETALSTMLASCSPGLAVVNIDNGFGAACLAERILAKTAGAEKVDAESSLGFREE